MAETKKRGDMQTIFRRRWFLMVTGMWLLVFGRPGFTVGQAQTGSNPPLQIESLSSRPDMVSGGDALLRVRTSRAVALEQVKVALNGEDVTGKFKPESDTHSLMGLVENLREGKNQLIATAGTARTELSLVDYPLAGPILYRPQIHPFICNIDGFALYGLTQALDSNCST